MVETCESPSNSCATQSTMDVSDTEVQATIEMPYQTIATGPFKAAVCASPQIGFGDLSIETAECKSIASSAPCSPGPDLATHAVDELPQQCLQQRPQLPLPARALRQRLHSHSTPPTWAAWLPHSLKETAFPSAMKKAPPQPAITEESYQEDSAPTVLPVAYTSDDGCYTVPLEPSTWVDVNGVVYQPVLMKYEEVQGFQDAGNMYEVEAGYAVPGYADPGYEVEAQQHYAQWPEQGQEQFPTAVDDVLGRVWKLSRDAQGSRRVQDAFDNACNDSERLAVTSELVGHVWDALKCQHANHVLQKCISSVSPHAVQFVLDELSKNGRLAQAARHRFGCRIIERLLEQCGPEQVAPMVDVLVADAAALSQHAFGHFVVQHLLEHCGPDVVARITSILAEHLPKMAAGGNLPTDGFAGVAGSVIGKALSQSPCDDKDVSNSLVVNLLGNPERLAVMSCSRWGHQAVKQALRVADNTTCHQACEELMRRSDRLRSSRYGRVVMNLAETSQGMPICAH